MNRKILFEIFLVMMIIMVGNASGELPACPAPGDTAITSSCQLADDYIVTAGNGYIIGADDVVIDGVGHKISGDVTSATCTAGQTEPCVTHSGIVNNGGYNNVVIKNLEIENFCTGVVMGVSVENMTVEECEIHDCGASDSVTHGIHIAGAYNCTIKGNEIYNQKGTADDTCGAGGNGISLHGVTADENYGGDWNTIIYNNLHNNAKCGLHAKFQCMHNTISHNLVTENAKSGIMPECKMSNYFTIEYNTITDNGPYYGFYTRGHDNVIRHNTITNTKGTDGHYNGIYISTKGAPGPFGENNIVSNNTVCGSQVEDILIDGTAADTNNVSDNTCDSTSGGTGNGCPCNCSQTQLSLSISASLSEVNVGEATNVTFTVTSDDNPVEGANVTLSGSADGSGTTEADGSVVISVNATSAGTITATAIKENYTDGTTTLTAKLDEIHTLSISASLSEVNVGEATNVTFTVTSDDNPVEGANVTLSGSADGSGTTEADGSVVISVNATSAGTITATANKVGYTDGTTALTAENGNGVSSSVSLSVNIKPTISLIVTPDNIDFGELYSGETSDVQSMTIENKGGSSFNVTTQVSDNPAEDTLFKSGLLLDSAIWSDYTISIDAQASVIANGSLNVPGDYMGIGQKQGEIVFWAQA